ncbi:hypothetical protein O181_020648 [Austropuccinia psidii MF-1]|uniref:Allantoicase domain-containing protein n=1 Tax=Austropuccinia psidii MF-1 TaxID=1389203 RepID=A0A9Q3CBU4_9BASI|nr:hypothetical protein [Austropuccinia psidii MF-1]
MDNEPKFQAIKAEDFAHQFDDLVELSSEELGGDILSVSDEWFAPAKSLLKRPPAESLSGHFGPNGALYDGWESRRHNPTHDWVILRLGVSSGTICGFDVDTSHFNGNEAPACLVHGLARLDPPPSSPDDDDWETLLPLVQLGPSARHLFKIPQTKRGYRYIKLSIVPDGGVARFRVYGQIIPIFPSGRFDLASARMGARVVFTSDQHYGVGANLILPGRGPKSMDGGWETKRSRAAGHRDFVIVKLATKGCLHYAEIDTNYFIGNFPQKVDLYATLSNKNIPESDAKWIEILSKSQLGPHRQQHFQLLKPQDMFSHVKMTIYPDGGVKRLRIFGKTTHTNNDHQDCSTIPNQVDVSSPTLVLPATVQKLPILPLSPAAFEPYGFVLEAPSDSRAWPPAIASSKVNFGTATKFNHVAQVSGLENSQPNLCIFSCRPWEPARITAETIEWKLKGLERHELSTQTFVPVASHQPISGCEGAIQTQAEGLYLIVVALDNDHGRPDKETLRAFMGTNSQGISYFRNIWHAPLIAIKGQMDFACLIYETGDCQKDCELMEMNDLICEFDRSTNETFRIQ